MTDDIDYAEWFVEYLEDSFPYPEPFSEGMSFGKWLTGVLEADLWELGAKSWEYLYG